MDLVFRAVADPTRREMLMRLSRGEMAVSELHAAFDMSQPAISQHLKVLREAGLVVDRQEGRSRRYRLRPEGLKAVYDWVSAFERFWSGRLDALERVLEELPEPMDERGRQR